MMMIIVFEHEITVKPAHSEINTMNHPSSGEKESASFVTAGVRAVGSNKFETC